MQYSIYNTKDKRLVFKHKRFNRYYVQDFYNSYDELEIYTTDNISDAEEVLKLTKKYWNGLNVAYWKVVEFHGEIR